jgi:hypothetical protein
MYAHVLEKLETLEHCEINNSVMDKVIQSRIKLNWGTTRNTRNIHVLMLCVCYRTPFDARRPSEDSTGI